MLEDAQLVAILGAYEAKRHELEIFTNGVARWFATHPELNRGPVAAVHSIRSRLKDPSHLREKLVRKHDDANPIGTENLFTRITDLGGVRVLHLHQEQFRDIHAAILAKVNVMQDWVLSEPVRAYSWDPESKTFFESLGVETEVRESFYTSVHYLVRPRLDSPLCCEIQVRTLFEEIWGEVDHSLNYPTKSELLATREQLRVLSKLVGAGSRLVDSIFRVVREDQAATPGA